MPWERATTRRGRGGVVVLAAAGVVAMGAWLGPRGEPARAADPALQKANDDTPVGKGKAKGKARERRGGQRVPGGVPPADARPAPDPLAPGIAAAAGGGGAAVPAPAGPPVWPFHYTLRMAAVDGVVLQASYFPARSAFRAPVVILIHQTGAGHSGKDFEEPLDELKGQSFARHLQEEGYAVLALDLRGAGGGRRDALQAADWRMMVADLQAAYRFLVDRHNRGELNLARLAVVGLGDGANLALAWAASPGGAVSSEGRLSDIAALVLISPVAEIPGQALARVVPELAARIPMLVVCGDQDEASVAAVRATQALFERHRQSRVVYHDTTLHAARLLGFYPKVAAGMVDFLDDLVGSRAVEWEPRYLLEPVEYGEVTLVADSGFEAPPAPPGAAAAPAAPPRNR